MNQELLAGERQSGQDVRTSNGALHACAPTKTTASPRAKNIKPNF
jgi:hypothetical protein